MARQTLIENQAGSYTANGTITSNNAKANANFAELYAALALGIVESEQMAPADTGVEVANDEKLTLPPGSVQAGDRLRISGFARVTSQNADNTLRPRIRIGGLTGVLIATVLPYDAANNDNIRFEVEVFFEAVGEATASKFHSFGRMKRTGGSDEDTVVVDNTTLDTTELIDIVFTQFWSANSESNRIKLYDLSAKLLRP